MDWLGHPSIGGEPGKRRITERRVAVRGCVGANPLRFAEPRVGGTEGDSSNVR